MVAWVYITSGGLITRTWYMSISRNGGLPLFSPIMPNEALGKPSESKESTAGRMKIVGACELSKSTPPRNPIEIMDTAKVEITITSPIRRILDAISFEVVVKVDENFFRELQKGRLVERQVEIFKCRGSPMWQYLACVSWILPRTMTTDIIRNLSICLSGVWNDTERSEG